MYKLKLMGGVILLSFLAGCGGGGTPNNPPVATDNTTHEGLEDTVLNINFPVTDPDGDTLTYAIIESPGNGVLRDMNGNVVTQAASDPNSYGLDSFNFASPNNDGDMLAYTPNANWHGLDSFSFTASDGHSTADLITVKLVIQPVNDAPSANAGEDKTAKAGANVSLDGKGMDVDNDSLRFSWVQTGGAGVSLNNGNAAQASFIAPSSAAGAALSFTLTVEDGKGGVATDSVNVRVEGTGTGGTGTGGTGTGGTGTGGTGTGGTGTGGTGTGGTGTGGTGTGGTGTGGTGTGGTGTGGTGTGGTGTVNQIPVANAGIDRLDVIPQSSIELNGAASGDNDGNIVSYIWTQISGEHVVLMNANTATASFISPAVVSGQGGKELVFLLTVTDDKGGIATDTVTVMVNAANTTNIPPVANAGADRTIDENTAINLDGSASRDPDGAIVRYAWSQTAGRNLALLDDNGPTPHFYAPDVSQDETFTYRLSVTDDQGAVAHDTVNILVRAGSSIQPTPTGRLNDTGITLCGDYAYGNSGKHNNDVVCSLLTDADGDPVPQGQDGTSGRDVTAYDNSDGHAGFSFTKISSSGATLPADATAWSCVKDNVTGLIWEVKTDDGGLHDKDWTYTWYDTNTTTNGGGNGTTNGGSCGGTSNCDTSSYVAAVNTAGWCGATSGWRMPTVGELLSIANLSNHKPAIDTAYFPNTAQFVYWSGTPYSPEVSLAWVVGFDGGNVHRYDRYNGAHVRLVRSGR